MAGRYSHIFDFLGGRKNIVLLLFNSFLTHITVSDMFITVTVAKEVQNCVTM